MDSLFIGWMYMQANLYYFHTNKIFSMNMVYLSIFSSLNIQIRLTLCSAFCFSFSEESIIKALCDTYLNVKGFMVSKNNFWMFLTISSIHSIFQMDKIKHSYLIFSYWIQKVLERNFILSHSSTCGKIPM